MDSSEYKKIRWKQRFQNFEKAYLFLKKSLSRKNLSDLEKAGIIQSYEFSFELAWKTLKDFLESKGIIAQFPRDVIKESFKNNLISDGGKWIDMLEKRNIMTHTYNEKTAELAFSLIKDEYIIQLNQLYDHLKIYLNKDE